MFSSIKQAFKFQLKRGVAKHENIENKKGQLSLTNPRDACEKFARFSNSSGVVSCIARLPIDSVPMVFYYVLYSNCL